jgi:hypothetical protein
VSDWWTVTRIGAILCGVVSESLRKALTGEEDCHEHSGNILVAIHSHSVFVEPFL